MTADRQPRVFLTDFGLAKEGTGHSGGLSPTRLTRSGQTLGTPAYMSPEQARGELTQLTPASDTWALGAVLYELLANRKAFQGDTPAAVIGAVMLARPAPLVGVPAPVHDLVRGTLQPAPRHRPATARVLAADLQRVLAGERPRHRAPRMRSGVIAAAALAATAIAASAGLWWGARPPAATPRPPATAPANAQEQRSAQAEQLARTGWEMRHVDREAAADRLTQALTLLPQRHGWRLQLGLVRWAAGRDAEALATWSAIPERAPQWRRARLYAGLEAMFHLEHNHLQGDVGTRRLTPLLAQSDEVAQVARGAIACGERRQAEALRVLEPIDFWAARLLRAQVQVQFGPHQDLPAAIREYTAALEQGHEFIWVYAHRGLAKRRTGDIAGAIADYNRALAINPDYAHAYLLRGMAKAHRMQTAEALADLQRAVELQPDNAHYRTSWGSFLVGARRFTEGLVQIERALELEPDNVVALSDKAKALRDLHRLPEALEAAERAVALNPGFGQAAIGRATILAEMRRHAEALVACDDLVRRYPDNAPSHSLRGRVLAALGRHPEALAELTHTLELDAGNLAAQDALAGVYLALGRHREALAAADATLARLPKLVEAHRDRGLALMGLERYPEALQAFERTDAMRPNDATTLYYKGVALGRLKRWTEAATVMRRCLELEPDDPDSLHGLASCLRRLKQWKEVAALFGRLLEVAPNYRMADEARRLRAEALAKLETGESK